MKAMKAKKGMKVGPLITQWLHSVIYLITYLAIIVTATAPNYSFASENTNYPSSNSINTRNNKELNIANFFKDLKSQNVMIKGKVYVLGEVDGKLLRPLAPNEDIIQAPNIKDNLKKILSKEQRAKRAQSISQSRYCIGCKWCGAPKSCGFSRCSKCTAYVPSCKAPCTCPGLEV